MRQLQDKNNKLKFKTKIGKTLSYTVILLLSYNFLCLLILDNDWYIRNQPIIDLCDTPFYAIAYLHLAFNWRKYNVQLKFSLAIEFIYLCYKIIDGFLHFDNGAFLWLNFLIISLPCVYWVVRKLNLDK